MSGDWRDAAQQTITLIWAVFYCNFEGVLGAGGATVLDGALQPSSIDHRPPPASIAAVLYTVPIEVKLCAK